MSARGQWGFTLLELVVAIAVGSVVVTFAAMFLSAPLDAFDAQSRRQSMVGDVNAAWPRMEQDLFVALPNSVRARPNGNFVALELMPVIGVTRYTATANISSTNIAIAGIPAGAIAGQPASTGATPVSAWLSVNPNANVYTQSGSITTRRALRWNTNAADGTGTILVPLPAPNFTAGNSPRRRLYVVGQPVTYLCDLRAGQGTLRRYTGYTVAASQTARDAPNEFGGAGSELIARGITACAFTVSGGGAAAPQTVSVRLTASRGAESVTLLHQSRAEYRP